MFGVAFWVAGIAALFSTADVQALGLMFTAGFNPSTGKANLSGAFTQSPKIVAFAFSAVLAASYYIVRTVLGVPFEKLVFIIIPAAITLLPVLIMRLRCSTWNMWHVSWLLSSVVAYTALSIAGLFLPNDQMWLNIVAAFVPVIVALSYWVSSTSRSTAFSIVRTAPIPPSRSTRR